MAERDECARARERENTGHTGRIFHAALRTMSREKVMKHPRRGGHHPPGLPELKQHYLFRGRTGSEAPRVRLFFSAANPGTLF